MWLQSGGSARFVRRRRKLRLAAGELARRVTSSELRGYVERNRRYVQIPGGKILISAAGSYGLPLGALGSQRLCFKSARRR